MTVLFRWIFLSTLMRVAAITLVLVSFFMIAESFDKARAIGNGMTVSILAEYLLLKVPYMISEFMPVIVLIGTAIYMAEVSVNHELVAIRAAGGSAWVLLKPLLAAGCVTAMFTFAVSEWIEPITNERLAYIERVNIEKKAPLRQGIQWLRDEQTLMKLTPLTGKYFSMLIIKTDEKGGFLERIDAEKAFYERGEWVLENAVVSRPDVRKGLEISKHKQLSIVSDISFDTGASPNPRDMTLLELNDFEKTLEEAGLESGKYQFQLHHKISSPLGCLIMILLAYSLCSNLGSRVAGNSKGLVLSVILGLLFYVVSSSIVILADGGQLPILYAVWLPNILFFGIAGFLLLKQEGY